MALDLVEYKDNLKNQEVPSLDQVKNVRDEVREKQENKDPSFAKRVENINITYFSDEGDEKKTSISSKVMDHEARLRYDRVLQ